MSAALHLPTAGPSLATDDAARRAALDGLQPLARSLGIVVEAADRSRPIAVTRGRDQILLDQRHWFYAKTACVHFDLLSGTVEPMERDGLAVSDFSEPRRHRLRGSDRTFFFSSLAEDVASTHLYLDYLAPGPGDVVLDLGSYCGLSASAFSDAVGPEGRVFCFEPDPRNFEILSRNLDEIGAGNVVREQKAISDRCTTLSFSSEGSMGSALIGEGGRNRDRMVEVETTTIRDIVRRHALSRVSCVKMDIEGAEYAVLDASADLIGSLGARWMIEVHGDAYPAGRVDVERLRALFDAAGHVSIVLPIGDSPLKMLFARPR